MIRPLIRIMRRRVIVDIDTQKDLLLAASPMCVRNHRRVLANIRRVVAWARQKNIRIISTVQICPGNDGRMAYCIDGTEGQKKLAYTLRKKRISFAADGSTDLPRDVMQTYDQVIFHKRCEDPFKEPRIDRLLSGLRADEFILIGATAEGAVKAAVLGLLQRKKKVTVVVDAVGSRDNKRAVFALRQMQAKGARLIEAKSLAGVSHLRLVGACRCDRCSGLLKKQPVATAERSD